jgi:triose/dihydroxyacetone kinase / FAD-AMP lyase (cyclizing)
MNRVINNPDLVVEDMLKGWLAAHAGRVVGTANPRVVKRAAAPEAGKVGIVTGGGSGHEPAFLGYVGEGLVDAVAIGEIFSSPTAKSFADAMRAADGGVGVACLYGNYAGDNMNVKMAIEAVAREGLAVKTVIANDDVPSAPKGDEAKRRGVAGEILMWKVGAAKAAQGASLDEVIAVAQKAIDNTRSIGVGLSACVIPAVGKANFTIEPGTMEVGIGHHGEPGIDVRKTVSASDMAEMMLGVVLPDLPFADGGRVAVLIAGLGATPLMEQYILYGEIARRLQARGIMVAVNHVGNLFTSLEMFGVTLTVMKLDAELEACLKAPCQAVGLTVGVTVAGDPAKAAASPTATASASTERAQPRMEAARRDIAGPAVALASAGGLVRDLIETINANRQFLSEIDGAIGDGDHGINMSKGFTGCGRRLDALGARADSLPAALEQLSQALMDDIGGSMGPLYGQFFAAFAQTIAPYEQMDAGLFGDALAQAVARVQGMGNAQVGDKTLIDTLVPARDAFRAAQGLGLSEALKSLSDAAEAGKNATRDMQARIGRSARLGPRSIGVLDAGATSCCLILQSMARSLRRQLEARYSTDPQGGTQ